MTAAGRDPRPVPPVTDTDLLAFIANTLHQLADAIATAATLVASSDSDNGTDPRRQVIIAGQELHALRDRIKTIAERAASLTQGSAHPSVVRALAALREALTEAQGAAGLLADDCTDPGGGAPPPSS